MARVQVAGSIKGQLGRKGEPGRGSTNRADWYHVATGTWRVHGNGAADVVAETFLTAWRRLSTYSARAPFEHWLTRVCLNCCYAALKKVRPEVPAPATEPVDRRIPDPAAGVEVERLLRNLSPEDRFILLLLEGEGWSVADIATKMGWTRVNVKVRAHRARRKLRKLLEKP